MYILSALLFSMFYVFVIVACNDASLRNMTTNLRGSDDQSEERIEKYTNAIAFEEPSYNLRGNGSIETYESQLITISNDDKLPDNFNKVIQVMIGFMILIALIILQIIVLGFLLAKQLQL